MCLVFQTISLFQDSPTKAYMNYSSPPTCPAHVHTQEFRAMTYSSIIHYVELAYTLLNWHLHLHTPESISVQQWIWYHLQDFMFSQWHCWRSHASGTPHCVTGWLVTEDLNCFQGSQSLQTMITTQPAARCCIPQHQNPQQQGCESFKFQMQVAIITTFLHKTVHLQAAA
jgi:hypothetical protein